MPETTDSPEIKLHFTQDAFKEGYKADFEIVGLPAQSIDDDDDDDDDPALHKDATALKDSKRCWVVCFAAFLLQAITVGTLHVFGVFFVALIDEFDCTRSEAGNNSMSTKLIHASNISL